MLQNTGAVISIAFVMAIVTAAVPKDVLLQIFSGVTTGLSRRAARPVHPRTCTPRCGCSPRPRVVGAAVSLLRPATARASARRCRHDAPPRRCASARSPSGSGTTTRTIRYYEEIGLLARGGEREAGRHRTYDEADVERLSDALRFKQLLGLSLDELKALLEAEEARAALRAEWRERNPGAGRRREILEQALGHIDRQLELVRRRRQDIDALEAELAEKRATVRRRMDEL